MFKPLLYFRKLTIEENRKTKQSYFILLLRHFNLYLFYRCFTKMATITATILKENRKKTDGTWNVLYRLTHGRKDVKVIYRKVGKIDNFEN